ncbi:MAG: DUF4870 domain-containing protein [Planctomycetota bacterium]|jgi:uncharacterized Tic20 family protein
MPDAQAPTSTPIGRVRDGSVSSSDRTYVLWMHLSTLLGFMVLGPLAFLIPLLMWQSRQSTGSFVDDHGREIMNLWITGSGLFVVGMITGIGMLAWVAWSIVTLINIVRACIAASESEYFRYPMLVRILS